ncbi:hypothetical protein DQ04_00661230 [Trypanosoma grayi]|uniref:hypothetical protein n=1 Tax=Trypanosoma grayi TaxID=71804 RepID=UPI0004F47DA0|nr:hypothetical protein DQ04_00661230 [Trypanosoma grayi]KEG14045.1 hypothetical protein DQ04_00661230 [Trypanosoma grayi]
MARAGRQVEGVADRREHQRVKKLSGVGAELSVNDGAMHRARRRPAGVRTSLAEVLRHIARQHGLVHRGVEGVVSHTVEAESRRARRPATHKNIASFCIDKDATGAVMRGRDVGAARNVFYGLCHDAVLVI